MRPSSCSRVSTRAPCDFTLASSSFLYPRHAAGFSDNGGQVCQGQEFVCPKAFVK